MSSNFEYFNDEIWGSPEHEIAVPRSQTQAKEVFAHELRPRRTAH